MLYIEYPRCGTCKKARKWLDEIYGDHRLGSGAVKQCKQILIYRGEFLEKV